MSETITLRLAKLSDAGAIARMSRDLIETGLGWQWKPERVARHIRNPDTAVLVAHARQRLIGFAIMHFGFEEAHLLLFAVHPAYRRSGTGRRLMHWLEKSARVAGIQTIYLEVRAWNQSGRAFYRALGYRTLQLMPCYYYAKEAAVRMARDLRVLS